MSKKKIYEFDIVLEFTHKLCLIRLMVLCLFIKAQTKDNPQNPMVTTSMRESLSF